MSKYEHKDGSFSLFKNDKQGNENRPDYTGEGKALDGTPIRVSAWLKEGQNGKFMSCRIEEKKAKESKQPAKQADFPDDDLDAPPF